MKNKTAVLLTIRSSIAESSRRIRRIQGAYKSGVYSSLIKSVTARAAIFGPTLVCSLAVSRLLIQHFGSDSYAAYALALTLIGIYPLNDVGAGAAIVSGLAAEGAVNDRVIRYSLTAARMVGISAIALIVAVVCIALEGLWPTILGSLSNVYEEGLTLCMIFYALSFVPALSQSLLLGGNKNHILMGLQGVQSLISLLSVISLLIISHQRSLVAAVPGFSQLVICLVGVSISSRLIHFRWGRFMVQLWRPRRYPGLSIRKYSLPMLVITVVLPLAWQSDRLILSHILNSTAVVNYSLTFQIFSPIVILVAAASQPLWPLYIAERAGNGRAPNIQKVALLFAICAAATSAILVGLSPLLASLISGDKVKVGLLLPISAAIMATSLAAQYPIGMYLMDSKGLRFQALCCAIALPTNLGLSILFTETIGPSGPLIGTAIAFLCGQLIPNIIYMRIQRAYAAALHARQRAYRPMG